MSSELEKDEELFDEIELDTELNKKEVKKESGPASGSATGLLGELQKELYQEEYINKYPKHEKAEPGIYLRGRHISNKTFLTATFVFLVLMIVIAAFFAMRLKNSSDIEGRAVTESETTLSDEELQALEKEKKINEELSLYTNLAVVNTEGYINVRSQQDSNDMTNIIGNIAKNAAMDVISEENGWSYIKSGNVEGYVSTEYITKGDDALNIARENIKERAEITVDVLNIRSAPEIDPQNVVGKARRGDRYELISIEGDWAKIVADFSDKLDEAYINIADNNAVIKSCLDTARKIDLRERALTQFENIVISNAENFINIRKTPEDKGIENICGKFPSKAGAELLETVESEGKTWYKIRSGNVTGYVSADYCLTGSAAKNLAVESAELTAYVRTDALNVRTEPSLDAKVWTQVTKNQAYHVLDQYDGWVEIELDSSDEDGESEKAFVSTRDNNVEVRYGVQEAIEYYPAVEAENAEMAFRNKLVNYACQFVGNPYVWGGTSLTNGADCSGFTLKVFEHFGIKLPRVSRDQAKAGVGIKSDKMKPGDLVFYANSQGTINHVGIYIGNGQVVNAASRRSGIRIYRWNYRTPVAIRNVIG
ncbi:MAG: SH3 domain-containing protein [Eubacteriales bacterium]|nr:SH3 domain-containing protein [Eubacteriales bacterium]